MAAPSTTTRFRPLMRLLATLGVVLLIFSAQRVLFFLLNREGFPGPPLSAFVGGLRFDASAIAWLYLPWTLAMLAAPYTFGWVHRLHKVLFHLSNAVCFFLNCTDLEYYKFTMKRSTADLFGIASGGSDMAHLAPVFAQYYWYVVLIFLGSMLLAEVGYRWAARRWAFVPARPWWAWRLAAIAVVVIASRGGTQYIPLTVLDASNYAAPAYMPLVLNSPFTVMTSVGKPALREMDLMPQAEADRLWPVVHQYGDSARVPPHTNVVIIILESFGATYSNLLNGGHGGYMPFLDSLMTQGMYCTEAYANGRRSIDGIPAVLASMPKMMEEALITSPYSDVPLSALPGMLAAQGYHTSFYHGGHNGTMGFDAFAASAGFQRYAGFNEFPDKSADDGVWGIRDRPFLQHFAYALGQEQEPFMSTVFTLSSHHPYQLLPSDAARCAGGHLPIHPTLRYADDALRNFFSVARTLPWFTNTLFVITADHTADLERNGEQAGSAYDYWIPLLFYMPGHIAPQRISRTTQQIDIAPTVLDLLGYDQRFFSHGASMLRAERAPAAVSQGSATWMMVTPRVQLRSNGEQVLWLAGIGSTYMPDSITRPDSADIAGAHRLLQASIQQFNGHLLRRDMVVK